MGIGLGIGLALAMERTTDHHVQAASDGGVTFKSIFFFCLLV